MSEENCKLLGYQIESSDSGRGRFGESRPRYAGGFEARAEDFYDSPEEAEENRRAHDCFIAVVAVYSDLSGNIFREVVKKLLE